MVTVTIFMVGIDTKTSADRLGWYVNTYLKMARVIVWVAVPVLLLASIATALEFQKVASMNYKLAHSFKPVH